MSCSPTNTLLELQEEAMSCAARVFKAGWEIRGQSEDLSLESMVEMVRDG